MTASVSIVGSAKTMPVRQRSSPFRSLKLLTINRGITDCGRNRTRCGNSVRRHSQTRSLVRLLPGGQALALSGHRSESTARTCPSHRPSRGACSPDTRSPPVSFASTSDSAIRDAGLPCAPPTPGREDGSPKNGWRFAGHGEIPAATPERCHQSAGIFCRDLRTSHRRYRASCSPLLLPNVEPALRPFRRENWKGSTKAAFSASVTSEMPKFFLQETVYLPSFDVYAMGL
jgi:hypothetical protein